VRLKGLGKLKKFISSGLDPTTFWLVAQCHNQLRYCMPLIQQVPVALSPEVKWLGYEVDHSSPASVKVKKILMNTYTPSYVFMA
jgi:hypothetical protein